MFFLGRYWALAFQMWVFFCRMMHISLSRGPSINLTVTHPHVLKKQAMDCHKWFGFQNSAVGILLVNFQIILMLRGMEQPWIFGPHRWVIWIVYALYERSTKMAVFLICWFVFYAGMMVLISRASVHVLKLDSSCMMTEAPNPKTTIAFRFGELSVLNLSCSHCQSLLASCA
jgi:hypothetical protein